jgi:hypothetical protein
MSVICWIVWRYAQARLPEERSSFFDFAAAQESAFVMANRSTSRSIIQLVGAEGADNELDTGKKRLDLKRLTKNIAFNIYVASSRQLNLTKQAVSGLNKLSEQRGEPLAALRDQIDYFLSELARPSFAEACPASTLAQALAFPILLGVKGSEEGWLPDDALASIACRIVHVMFMRRRVRHERARQCACRRL